MAYIVIENFADVQHNNRIHYKGEIFPSGDYDVNDDRISELVEKKVIKDEYSIELEKNSEEDPEKELKEDPEEDPVDTESKNDEENKKKKSEPKGKTKES